MPQNPWEQDWSKVVPQGTNPWDHSWNGKGVKPAATAPDKGVDDPAREMNPKQFHDHLRDEATLSLAEGFGIDLSHPVTGTIKNFLSTLALDDDPAKALEQVKTLAGGIKDLIGNGLGALSNLGEQVKEVINPGSVKEDLTAGAVKTTQDMAKAAPLVVGAAEGIKGAVDLGKAMHTETVLGRTTIDPLTGKPVKPPAPVIAPLGERPPAVSGGIPVQYGHPSVELAAKAINPEASAMEARSIAEDFNIAFRDLKDAQRTVVNGKMELGGINGGLERAARYVMDRIWNKGIEPLLKGDQHTNGIADAIIAKIPDSVPTAEAAKLAKKLHDRFDGTHTTKQIQGWLKESNAEVRANRIANDFDQAAAENTKAGQLAMAENDAIRNYLYEAVKNQTGVDIQPLMARYGAASSIAEMAGTHGPKTGFLKGLIKGPVYPSVRGAAAKVGAAAAREMVSDNALLAKAFDQFKFGPEDAKAISLPKPSKVPTGTGGAMGQFRNPSGVATPGIGPYKGEPRGPIDQFAHPSGVAPRGGIEGANQAAPHPDPYGVEKFKTYKSNPNLKVTEGPAKGMTLDSIERDPITSRPTRYHYIDSSTGKRLSFTSPQTIKPTK